VRRREFITLLGGVAAPWPLVARAQQPQQMRRIGVLLPYEQGDPEAQARNAAIQGVLKDLGWSEGRNVEYHFRWASNDIARLCLWHPDGAKSLHRLSDRFGDSRSAGWRREHLLFSAINDHSGLKKHGRHT
jgi:hypothetical protein